MGKEISVNHFNNISDFYWSRLVLESGAMADNGELFVLDMGKPVKIMDLATNMISLMGARNIEIVETGLRPGEKLYEELLVKKEDLEKTDNDLIFCFEIPLSEHAPAVSLPMCEKDLRPGFC